MNQYKDILVYFGALIYFLIFLGMHYLLMFKEMTGNPVLLGLLIVAILFGAIPVLVGHGIIKEK